jgi:hypothetical protein
MAFVAFVGVAFAAFAGVAFTAFFTDFFVATFLVVDFTTAELAVFLAFAQRAFTAATSLALPSGLITRLVGLTARILATVAFFLERPGLFLIGESVPNNRPLACCNLEISPSICLMISSVFMFPPFCHHNEERDHPVRDDSANYHEADTRAFVAKLMSTASNRSTEQDETQPPIRFDCITQHSFRAAEEKADIVRSLLDETLQAFAESHQRRRTCV